MSVYKIAFLLKGAVLVFVELIEVSLHPQKTRSYNVVV